MASTRSAAAGALDAWFEAQGWRPFKFQREVWRAMAAGRSGMLHATTGAGKTYAIWVGALRAWAPRAPKRAAAKASAPTPVRLTVLWLTPMRALAADTLRALEQPLAALGAELHPWRDRKSTRLNSSHLGIS